jgi:L-ribulose-5-phosphate 4-epimerase
MSLQSLREEVLDANLELVRRGLVVFTFGNASGYDRASGKVVIKPSGVPYEQLTPESLVVTDLDGKILEGSLRPSSDLPTHLALYHAFPGVHGVVHTHSRYATSWAQAGVEIPCLGTTHADYFRGPIPITPTMEASDIRSAYEWNTGQAIVGRLAGIDPLLTPAVLVAGHAPFCWGASVTDAAHTAVVVEEIAHMAYLTVTIRADAESLSDALRDKHFLRKHGSDAYYGQVPG